MKARQVQLANLVQWVLRELDFLGLRENEENPEGLAKEVRQVVQVLLDPQATANFVIHLLNKPIDPPQRRALKLRQTFMQEKRTLI